SEGRAFDEELAKVRRRFVSDWLTLAGKDRAQHWGWHNTYTYTKSIGEQIIAKSGIPFVIARPASCESTVAFPFPGWNDGMSTSSVVIYLALKGAVQIPGKAVPLDFMPPDMVVAGMVLSLVELLEGTNQPVYQFGMSDVNPATAERQGELIGLYKRRHYQKKNTGNPLFNMAMSHMEAFAVDPKRFEMIGPPAVARATKTASKALKNMGIGPLRPIASALEKWSAQEQKLGEVLGMFAPFTAERNGPFECSNTRAAYARLSPQDKARLDWTPEKIDWVDWFLEIHMPAVEKWALPEMDRKLKREPKALRAHDTLVTLLDQMAERHGISTALARFETDGFAPITYKE
ncbi:MAG: SDR family oxidoreductase, partial [Polyangiaceae bacterium]